MPAITPEISILHPCAALRTADNGLDYFHVGDGVLNRRWHTGVVQYRLRKSIALNCILVADIKQDFLDLGSMLVPDFARSIRWGVERDLDLNSPRSTEDVNPLIRL